MSDIMFISFGLIVLLAVYIGYILGRGQNIDPIKKAEQIKDDLMAKTKGGYLKPGLIENISAEREEELANPQRKAGLDEMRKLLKKIGIK